MHLMNRHTPTYYGYDSSVSLPVLNDKKDKSFKHVHGTTEKVIIDFIHFKNIEKFNTNLFHSMLGKLLFFGRK